MNIFLSLSFVDAAFVRAIHARLSRGVARYFERSFERGSDLISAMEAALDETQVFVLFASRALLQELATHLNWLRDEGYGRALCVLPRDGGTNERITAVSFENAINAAGFNTKVVPNQGKGATKERIEAARRPFPRMWFNEDTMAGGRKALGWYHEKQDEHRNIGLGPSHDWASHGADAFGLMCIDYEEPRRRVNQTHSANS